MPGKQAVHCLISVNNFCVLPVEDPELPMASYMVGKLGPLLVHGDRIPVCIGQGCPLQEHPKIKQSALASPCMLQARSRLLPFALGRFPFQAYAKSTMHKGNAARLIHSMTISI